ncbi:Rne/Rng family ribonuclease [Aureimonas leprariae]|uniref:Ribonuclease E n=1 Tax=Plantimonas leprariae TaxID=2615207 RepID=A0A7V7TXZ1_9HYPH|nr:Rne/Rng family ribonuclease [Aureimonas leprariae]KAB0681820.1 Rne/Rng family ribonuclease [Aureimonas leprariae]
MANKMLIDASHPEETRVVVLKGNRIEEFDFESEHKKQIKGNIYLAKVTRVEPSLQAAFVEYGGNRHGFLAFSEIHPDYYQIPIADRQALVEEDLLRAKEEEEAEERKLSREREPAARREPAALSAASEGGESVSEAFAEESADEHSESSSDFESEDEGSVETVGGEERAQVGDEPAASEAADERNDAPEAPIVALETNGDAATGEMFGAEEAVSEQGDPAAEGEDRPRARSGRPSGGDRSRRGRHRRRGNGAEDDVPGSEEEEVVEEIGSEDAMEEVPSRAARPPRKHYKIQEVIKRRQILLVQVVKEERGNKGAALTTYLSLAGRYSVLMPNTARGGGISRKITNVADRKRLKEVVRDLEVPRGMGIILRTAGAMRTKAEVKRDYEYLMRLWETVRNLTLASSAPALVYEEGSLIKRSIRDLYNKDIDQILVSGDNGYREAKDFMRMLLPSQAKVVQPYREPSPIFGKGGIEAQLDRMLQPHVTLKSGGYIIINQTEALVSIDVNSGRSTREHSVEDTALQTNLEAAEEIARQLRLRDLAGLIVVDFIDMDEGRNNRAVEKKMKDCLKDDRARIQVGRISHFGLLEMSRQRIRASVLESTTQVCPTCSGMGFVRSNSSLGLHVIRTIEEYVQKQSTHDITVRVPTSTALYVLNEKRKSIDEIERTYGLRVAFLGDDSHGHQHVAIEQGAEAAPRPVRAEAVSPLTVMPEELEAEPLVAEPADDEVEAEAGEEARSEEGGRRRRRRRRGGRRADGSEQDASSEGTEAAETDDDAVAATAEPGEAAAEETAETSEDDQGDGRKRRRRGRRGGGRRSRAEGDAEATEGDEPAVAAETSDDGLAVIEALPEIEPEIASSIHTPAEEVDDEPAATDDLAAEAIAPVVAEAEVSATAEEFVPESATDANEVEEPVEEEPKRPELLEPLVTTNGGTEDAGDDAKPKRTGWWARRSFF